MLLQLLRTASHQRKHTHTAVSPTIRVPMFGHTHTVGAVAWRSAVFGARSACKSSVLLQAALGRAALLWERCRERRTDDPAPLWEPDNELERGLRHVPPPSS